MNPDIMMGEVSSQALMTSMVAMMQQQQKIFEELIKKKPTKAKVEGISMPHYRGELTEYLDLFFEQSLRFFEAKNIDWELPKNEKRVLAMMASNLRGGAAAWYTMKRLEITNIKALFEALQAEFVPADLQERLRDMLYDLKQRDCIDLPTYITRHRKIMC